MQEHIPITGSNRCSLSDKIPVEVVKTGDINILNSMTTAFSANNSSFLSLVDLVSVGICRIFKIRCSACFAQYQKLFSLLCFTEESSLDFNVARMRA